MDWDGDQLISRYTPIHYDDNSILVLRESAVCTVIAKDLTDSNDSIVVLLSLALKQESTAKKSNATQLFDFRAVRKQSNFTSLPNPSDNDLIQPWEFTVNYGLHLIKNSDNYIQDENGKTWVAACSEKNCFEN